jgi:hypothetical protein
VCIYRNGRTGQKPISQSRQGDRANVVCCDSCQETNARSNLLLHEFDRLQTEAYGEPLLDISSTCSFLALSAPCGCRVCSAMLSSNISQPSMCAPEFESHNRYSHRDTDVHRAGLLGASGNASVSGAPALLRVPVGMLNNKIDPGYLIQRKA